MSSADEFALQKASILFNLTDKNAEAQRIIKQYAAKHAAMDTGVGLISLLPGAGIPALIGAIALQSQVIYKPMAKDLAAVYLSETDSYTDKLGLVASVTTVGIEFAQEFALQFLVEQSKELLIDAGLGALATTIPVAGAFIGAALDYLIAQMMTWRVGTMTSIYFQNGANWIETRKSTMAIAKDMTGGLHVGLTNLVFGLSKAKKESGNIRVDFDQILNKVPLVRQAAINNILPLLKVLANKLPRDAVKESLLAMRLPVMLVDLALQQYYSRL
jgi:hypothetical protein